MVVLLRRHSSNGRLCCDNNANNLEVTDVDSWGFVTEVKCTGCNQIMETTCHDAKSTYERIYNKANLKPGDHICWYRSGAYEHHAIVTRRENDNLTIIQYFSDSNCNCCECACACINRICCGCVTDCNSNCCARVTESDMPEDNKSCNALFRVNYQDCYDAGYATQRAQKLLDERRYNLVLRNCEHLIRWCKTGITNSIQVGVIWVSLAKLAFTIGLRVIALVIILGLITYIHEELEETTKDRQWLEKLERWLTAVYIIVFTVVFIIYLLIKSGSRLHPVGMRRHNKENPCSCSDQCCDCSSCTCCRRPCNLACGRFWHIVIREFLALGVTLCVVIFEEPITNMAYMAQMSAIQKAALLITYSTAAQIAGYAGGVLLGRWVEACFDCCERSRCCMAAPVNNKDIPPA